MEAASGLSAESPACSDFYSGKTPRKPVSGVSDAGEPSIETQLRPHSQITIISFNRI
jgi:hypothetical protein